MSQPWRSIGGLILALILTVPALAEEKKDNLPEGKPATEQSADKDVAADPYAVPQGTPQELKDFIQQLIRNMPKDAESRKKARAAMLKAAEIMLSAGPNDEDLDFAVEVKLLSLDKPEDIKAFGEELKKAGHEKQARAAQNYSLESGMHESIRSGKTDLQKKQIDAIIDYLSQAPPQPADLRLAIMVGQVAELQGDNAYAVDVYRKLSKAFVDSKEQQLAEFGKRLEGVVRRLSLLGNKMKLEGKLLSGEAFDFTPYQGKVVLIDFWASWRQASAADLPELKKIYELYHDKGFEIIGVACDYRREDVERFIKGYEHPWATVYGDKGPSPTFVYYGILTFPTMMLLDKDGKVKELNVSADELGKKVEKLLGPAEAKK